MANKDLSQRTSVLEAQKTINPTPLASPKLATPTDIQVNAILTGAGPSSGLQTNTGSDSTKQAVVGQMGQPSSELPVHNLGAQKLSMATSGHCQEVTPSLEVLCQLPMIRVDSQWAAHVI